MTVPFGSSITLHMICPMKSLSFKHRRTLPVRPNRDTGLNLRQDVSPETWNKVLGNVRAFPTSPLPSEHKPAQERSLFDELPLHYA